MDTSSTIKACVTSYKIDSNDFKTVLYLLDVTCNQKYYRLEKRYSQFDDFNKSLRNYFGDSVPELPKKSYLTFIFGKTVEQLNDRKTGLDEFVQLICLRKDIINSAIFKHFFEIDKIQNDHVQFESPYLVYCIDDFLHGIRDFHFINDDVLMLVNSEMSALGRMDAYLSNMKFPWQSEKGEEISIPVGCLECWVKNSDGQFYQKWTKTYNSQAICLFYCKALDVLLVGLDSGSINYLQIQRGHYEKYNESLEIEQHYARIMGLYYDPKKQLIHSIAKDGKYRVLSWEEETLVIDEEPGVFELTYLMASEEKEKVFIGDRVGTIFIYDIKKKKPQLLNTIDTYLKFIRGIHLDLVRNYLFVVGYEDGIISVFDINNAKRDVQLKELAKMKNPPKSRELCWSSTRGELYVGNENGNVTIWNARCASPMCKEVKFYNISDVFNAHTDEIMKMVWDEQKQILITSSKDRSVKIWKLPDSWLKIITYEVDHSPQEMNKQMEEEQLNVWHK